MHGNLEPEERVLSTDTPEIEWDIEDLKQAYIKGAEQYDRLMGELGEKNVYLENSDARAQQRYVGAGRTHFGSLPLRKIYTLIVIPLIPQTIRTKVTTDIIACIIKRLTTTV